MSEAYILNTTTIPFRYLRTYLQLPDDARPVQILHEAAKKRGVCHADFRSGYRSFRRSNLLPPFADELYRELLRREQEQNRTPAD